MIYHTLVPHKRTVDMNTPRDLQRTRFNTCKNSSAKAKSSDRRKRSYYLQVAAETFIINVCQQIFTRTPFCQPFHFNVLHKAFFFLKTTPDEVWALSVTRCYIALWNLKFRHTKGDSMDTDTVAENRPMSEFSIFFSLLLSPTVKSWEEELQQ